ncbi:MAG: hypothetical protein L0Y72_15735 [Gemmataceae bacterium]|nr:hypothetical protein [Gemmataceae bacterium]MCI0740498.1 hypothetical protein [Gemmataceae bacterium]
MSTATQELLLERELNDQLRSEPGWEDVASGLGKILLGHGIWFAGTMFAVLLILMPFIESAFKLNFNRISLVHMWLFYAGLGILSIVAIFSYGMILGGLWKCLLKAPERRGCRFLMFTCMTCMAMCPVLSIVSWAGGIHHGPNLDQGVAGLRQVRYTQLGLVLQLASAGVSMLFTGSFALFLRGTSQCMYSGKHVDRANLFLAFFVPLTIASVWVGMKVETDLEKIGTLIKPLMYVGIGWIVCLILWMSLVFSVRSCILKTLERVRNPIDYSGMSHGNPLQRARRFG